MAKPREWLWRVLIPFLWIDLVLGVAVSVAAVIPRDLTDQSLQNLVSIYAVAALVVGLAFGFAAWLVTLISSVVLSTAMSWIPRVPAVAIALAVPGIVALALYRPWESETVGLVSGTAAILVALTLAAIAAVLVIFRAERTERLIDSLVENV